MSSAPATSQLPGAQIAQFARTDGALVARQVELVLDLQTAQVQDEGLG